MDEEIAQAFILESTELLSDADGHLLHLEKEPTDREALNAVFRGFHTIKGVAGFLDLKDVERLGHATEDLLDKARDGEVALSGAALDLVFESTDRLKLLIGQIPKILESGVVHTDPAVTPLVERIRSLIGMLVQEDVSGALELEPSDGSAEQSAEAMPAQVQMADAPIRVDAERLDRLVDAVGELVINEGMVAQMVKDQIPDPHMLRQLQRLAKITREVQELAGSLRMVPVRASFRKMARLARDVAKKAGKRVNFKVSGEDTELDKSVVDRIGDPLVHLVRNAIDHGVEAPDIRSAQQKPLEGQVELRAFHQGGSIHIEIADDGKGLDRDAILSKAKAKGLVHDDDQLAEHEVFALVCEPGFSTAEKITSISGRGVGMDVVKRQIDGMGGTLSITSQAGKGSCFAMQLPLTLAVIEGMVVRIGGERYIVPTLSVVRMVEPKVSDLTNVSGRGQVLMVGGQLLPVLAVGRLFGNADSTTGAPLGIVVESSGSRYVIMIEEVVGQQQVVIKSLGEGLGETPGITGCAIMPDGRVGLVLDVAGLVRYAGSGSIAPAAAPSDSGHAAQAPLA